MLQVVIHVSNKHQKHIILVGNLVESINMNFSFLIFCFVIACRYTEHMHVPGTDRSQN